MAVAAKAFDKPNNFPPIAELEDTPHERAGKPLTQCF
jgi:hypothetical protein